ncbi:hypothetical protein ZWY2020_020464 [Hordeum vulgare]|nr:hypothetical protein ZWY2020_020464 [Hordeum vulgare]
MGGVQHRVWKEGLGWMDVVSHLEDPPNFPVRHLRHHTDFDFGNFAAVLQSCNLHKKPLPDVICAAVNRAETEVTTISANCSGYLRERSLSGRDHLAVTDCMELLENTMEELVAMTADLESPCAARRPTMDHAMTVLSAAITNQQTCLEGFSYQKGREVRRYMEPGIVHIAKMVSNSLAMAKKLPGATKPS